MKPLKLTPELLDEHPLPDVAGADKEDRGHILVIAGCREMPGAAVLAATAALRAGAGKLTIATAASIASGIAFTVPESRTVALKENADGAITKLDAASIETLSGMRRKIDAVLLGPGMQDEPSCCAVAADISKVFPDTPIILDALAMSAVTAGSFGTAPLLTPHAGEMAHLTGMDKDSILADPVAAALQWARRWGAIVALKGATTVVATPDGQCWMHAADNAGLATSGSGDVLAGIMGGLAARQMPLPSAALWGVMLHARAGERLNLRHGSLGYLARDISAQIPDVLCDLNMASQT